MRAAYATRPPTVPEIIRKVCERQKVIKKQIEKQKKLYGSTNLDPRAFLVMDDCMFDQSWIKDKNIRMLLCNGRHWHMFFLITLQWAHAAGAALSPSDAGMLAAAIFLDAHAALGAHLRRRLRAWNVRDGKNQTPPTLIMLVRSQATSSRPHSALSGIPRATSSSASSGFLHPVDRQGMLMFCT
jgi:hypothetical protein